MSEQNNDIEQNKTDENDEKMAVKFPDWDLLPPDILIRRQKNEK